MLSLDPQICYQALLSHDNRFDGRFYIAVSSTKIYCRNVCRVKVPAFKNCTFYHTAAAAEKAGYRPCLRCRPEIAPGQSPVDSVSRLAYVAANRIEEGALTDKSLTELAQEMGISDRHLRRVIEMEYGVTPLELAQTHRLLNAKRLLTDSNLSITEVAFASGFSSLRRFNTLFKERYKLTPSSLRKRPNPNTSPESIVCELGYRGPLDWASIMSFFAARSTKNIEMVVDGKYLRTVNLDGTRGWVQIIPIPESSKVRVEMSTSLSKKVPQLLGRIKRLFDLRADPQAIATTLGALAESNPGLRLPGTFDGFECALRIVLGQQVSVRAATTLASRLAERFGEPIETPYAELNLLSPTAESLRNASIDEICSLGITSARARTIKALATTVLEGTLQLDSFEDLDELRRKLLLIPGIGPWSVESILMRVFSYPDAFPHSDLGIRKALNVSNEKDALQIAEQWRPWRSYAVMHMWSGLNTIKPVVVEELSYTG